MPAWLASITHVPAGAESVTTPVEALIVQPEVDEPSTESTTALPEAPPPLVVTV